MATSYEKIGGYLDEMGIEYKMGKGGIYTGTRMKAYLDRDGVHYLPIVIWLQEHGEYIEVISPRLYTYKDGPHKLAVLQTCLMVSWKTKLIQFEYDETDGEIRALIEFPLEDAELTQKQFARVLFGIVQLVDKYHPAFQAALETGKVDFSGVDDDGQRTNGRQVIEELLEQLGPDGLREVAEEVAKRRAGASDASKPPEAL